MTTGEQILWAAVYAASWHQSTGRSEPGAVGDEERARWASHQAGRALEALRLIEQERGPLSQTVREVLA